MILDDSIQSHRDLMNAGNETAANIDAALAGVTRQGAHIQHDRGRSPDCSSKLKFAGSNCSAREASVGERPGACKICRRGRGRHVGRE